MNKNEFYIKPCTIQDWFPFLTSTYNKLLEEILEIKRQEDFQAWNQET